jgi:transposase
LAYFGGLVSLRFFQITWIKDDLMAKSLLSDELWAAIEPLLPRQRISRKGGRPAIPHRVALTGILFVLKTGIPWEDLPTPMGCSGMTCWRRLRDLQKRGIWAKLHRLFLSTLHCAGKIDWSRTVIDSAYVRAVGGGRTPAPIPQIAAS